VLLFINLVLDSNYVLDSATIDTRVLVPAYVLDCAAIYNACASF
jgi:hypothetical protein